MGTLKSDFGRYEATLSDGGKVVVTVWPTEVCVDFDSLKGQTLHVKREDFRSVAELFRLATKAMHFPKVTS